jgi:hypothetical protein
MALESIAIILMKPQLTSKATQPKDEHETEK